MNTSSVKLSVKGKHIPSFKNRKRLMRGRIVTDPKVQQQMEAIIQSFVSQLLCCTRTIGEETLMEQSPLCSIVSLLPEDDSRQWIPEQSAKAIDCDKGGEGAIVEITML